MISSSNETSVFEAPTRARSSWLKCPRQAAAGRTELTTATFELADGWTAQWYFPLSKGVEEWSNLAKTDDLFLSADYLALLAATHLAGIETGLLLFRRQGQAWGTVVQHFTFAADEQLGALSEANPSTTWERLRYRWQVRLARVFRFRLLLAGNMLLTGEHACRGERPSAAERARLLTQAMELVARQSPQRIHALLIKDMGAGGAPARQGYHTLPVQPNMVLTLAPDWKNLGDYMEAMSSKYRVRVRRARKKARGIQRRELSRLEIEHFQDRLYELYRAIADKSTFNAVQLPADYFSRWKSHFPDRFRLWGYFQDEELVGFSTGIRNALTLEAHYLGFDQDVNRDTQLYLNMLYDLVEVALNEGLRKVNFSRTALEIKSSVGAKAEELPVWVRSRLNWVNDWVPRIAHWMSPVPDWHERHPFR